MSRRKHRSKTERSPRHDGAAVEEHDGAGDASRGDGEPERAAEETSRPSESEGSGLEQQVERLEAEAEQMRDLALRKQAEFENYRKRMERERSETLQYAAAEMVREILPVLDNLERALGASEPGSEAQLREGLSIIYKQFKDILERRGLLEVASEQEVFDPHVHEAVSRVETDAVPEGSVVEVFQKGYRFKDRLLRPAMVSVALPASDETSATTDSSSDENGSD